MKKLLFCALFVFGVIFSSFAVPRGSYYNNRYMAALVDDNGDIHVLDRNGTVLQTLRVIQENNDGSFVCKVVAAGGRQYDGPTYHRNAYFSDDYGRTCLNLQVLSETLVRQ